MGRHGLCVRLVQPRRVLEVLQGCQEAREGLGGKPGDAGHGRGHGLLLTPGFFPPSPGHAFPLRCLSLSLPPLSLPPPLVTLVIVVPPSRCGAASPSQRRGGANSSV